MAMFDKFCEYSRARYPTHYALWSRPRQELTNRVLASDTRDPATRVMVIKAQNVADYYMQGARPGIEPDMGEKVFGCLRLPARFVWIEFCLTEAWHRACGAFMLDAAARRGITPEHDFAQQHKAAIFLASMDAHTMSMAAVWGTRDGGFAVVPFTLWLKLNEAHEWHERQICVTTDWDFQERVGGPKVLTDALKHQEEDEAGFHASLCTRVVNQLNYPGGVALTTLMFIHSKNTLVRAVVPDARLQKKRRARKKLPLATTHTVEITPVHYTTLTNQAPADRHAPTFHLVRGHLADYCEKGLFGKQKGVFWIPQHARGNLVQGHPDTRYTIAPAHTDTTL